MIQRAWTMIFIIRMVVFNILELMIGRRITWDLTGVIVEGKSSHLLLTIVPSIALSHLKWSQTPTHSPIPDLCRLV